MKEHKNETDRKNDIDDILSVYKDERYTLGHKDGLPCLAINGMTFILSCHPFEPCLYITDDNGLKTAVHNSFDPDVVFEKIKQGRSFSSITGLKYDAQRFCQMVEYASDKGNINIDDAEIIFKDLSKKKDNEKTEKNNSYNKDRIPETKAEIIADEEVSNILSVYPDIEVDYRIVKYAGKQKGPIAHRYSLASACKDLFNRDGKDGSEWQYDCSKAEEEPVKTEELFSRSEEKRAVNYRGAFLYPPHGGWCSDRDFDSVNEALFPNGIDDLEVYKWSTDWSEFFDMGHEWWGALCYTVYDKTLDRFVVIFASATD